MSGRLESLHCSLSAWEVLPRGRRRVYFLSGYFLSLIAIVFGVAVQVGGRWLSRALWWFALPLLVIAVYWTQAGQLAWTAVWPALIIAMMWARCLPAASRCGNRSYIVASYTLLLIGVAVGGIPVWNLLCLLPAPLAWRAHKLPDVAISEMWAIVTGMFLIVGYLIKGLIR